MAPLKFKVGDKIGAAEAISERDHHYIVLRLDYIENRYILRSLNEPEDNYNSIWLGFENESWATLLDESVIDKILEKYSE